MPQPMDEPRTLSDAAFLRLRADIMTGALKPGAKLKIGDLVARYEVGASPLREALARLSSDHMVVLEGQRGFSVASISREELADSPGSSPDRGGSRRLVDLTRRRGVGSAHRGVLLPAAEGASPSRCCRRWSLDWEDCNRQFHDALVSDCGSVWLLRLQQQLYAQSVRYRFISFDQPQPPRDGDAEHKALMDACLARNVERARRLTIEHIERTAKAVAAILPSSTCRGQGRVAHPAGVAWRPGGEAAAPRRAKSEAGERRAGPDSKPLGNGMDPTRPAMSCTCVDK